MLKDKQSSALPVIQVGKTMNKALLVFRQSDGEYKNSSRLRNSNLSINDEVEADYNP